MKNFTLSLRYALLRMQSQQATSSINDASSQYPIYNMTEPPLR